MVDERSLKSINLEKFEAKVWGWGWNQWNGNEKQLYYLEGGKEGEREERKKKRENQILLSKLSGVSVGM